MACHGVYEKINSPFQLTIGMRFYISSFFQCRYKEGLTLWFGTVLPNLFPFILITNILTYLNGLEYLSKLFALPFKKLFGVRASCCYSIFIGFFWGYPMGAKAIADSLDQHLITRARQNTYWHSVITLAQYILSTISYLPVLRTMGC